MKFLKSILYFLSILIIIYLIYLYWEDFKILKSISYFQLTILVIPTLLNIYLQASQFAKVVYLSTDIKNFKSILAITGITAMYNNIIPMSGGAALRGVLFKKRFNLPWSSVASLLGAYYMLSYLAMASLLIIASSMLFFNSTIEVGIYLATFLIFLVILIAITFLYTSNYRLKGKGMIFTFINSCMDGFNKFRNKYQLQWTLFLEQIVIVLLSATKLYLCFYFLDISVDYWKILVFQSFLVMSLFVAITPGNLGIQEGLFMLFADFLNLEPEIMLVSALLYRVTNLLGLFLSGLISKIWLIRN